MTRTHAHARKTMLLIALLSLSAAAQKNATADTLSAVEAVAENVRANGHYKVQEVVSVPDATADILYQRALQALSDWSGPDGNARTQIDYSDKATSTVIYKGSCPLPKEPGFLYSWQIIADFSLKIRCKDGRAQTTLTISQVDVSSTNPKDLRRETMQLTEFASRLQDKGNKGRKKRATHVLLNSRDLAALLTAAMHSRLSAPLDDDF